MEYLIRTCEKRDLPGLVQLCKAHAAYENSNYDTKNKIEALNNAIFSTAPQLYVHVIESQKMLVGYFSFTYDFSTWDAQKFMYLDCLYLEPNFRNSGIGSVILQNLETIAKQNNCLNIQWQTPAWNEIAIKFYNKNGAIGYDKVRFIQMVKL